MRRHVLQILQDSADVGEAEVNQLIRISLSTTASHQEHDWQHTCCLDWHEHASLLQLRNDIIHAGACRRRSVRCCCLQHQRGTHEFWHPETQAGCSHVHIQQANVSLAYTHMPVRCARSPSNAADS